MSYNLSQLRILWEMGLDGLKNDNIMLYSQPADGDYSPLNVKTDIVEQKYKTHPEQVGANQVFLSFDAGISDDPVLNPAKSIYIDTFAMLGTNLSGAAIVNLYGYGDVGTIHPSDPWTFMQLGTLVAQIPVNGDPYETDLIWCAPTQPTERFQHWLVEIVDPTNQDGFIEIGRVIGGQATILTELENFTDNFSYLEESYIDEMQINGFTSIANQRALKKRIKLEFNKLNMLGDNWRSLRRLLRYVRTTKKSLIIPDSRDPYMMHLFAKVKSMPEYSASFVDASNLYADFSLEFDEAR